MKVLMVSAVLCAGSAFAEFAYVTPIVPSAGESVTVEFPAGDYSHAEGMKIELPNTLKTSVRLYGPNTTWTMPDSDSAYPTYPFHVTQDGKDAVYLKPAAALLTQSPLKFANFDVTTSFDKPKETLSTVFAGGTYNFYDPNGTTPATMPEIYFDNKNGRNVQEVVFSGANTRLPKVMMTGTTAVTNRLVFGGGTHEIMGELQAGNSSARWYEVFVTNSANVKLNGEFRFNSSKASLLDVRDSTVVFGGTAQRYFGNTTYTPWTFRAVNSSVRFVPNWACMGFTSKDGNVGHVAMSNCVFVTDAVLQLSGDLSAEFVDCVVTNVNDYTVCCYDYTHGETTRIRYAGDKARSRIGGETRFGMKANMLCDFEIAGGYHTFISTDSNWRMAETSDGYLKFTVSGGTVDRDGKAFDFGYAAGATVDLYLTGGTVKASKIGKRTAGSTVNLVANGSVFQAAAEGTVVSGFDTAEIGEKGFTIDTNGKALTFDQDFTGTGPLILQGGGSVAFTSGNTVDVPVIVKGGTKLIPNGVEMKGLTMGDETGAATLKVDSTKPLTVDGDVVLTALKLELDGGFAKRDDAYTLITVTGDFSAGSAAVWADAMVASGAVPGTASDFIVVESASGKELMMKVRDPMDLVITVREGVSNITEAITYTDLDSLTADVWTDAELTLAGPVKRGPFVKTGAGALKIPDPSLFAVSLNTFRAGAVEFGGDSFFRLAAPFVLSAADDQTQVTVRTADDLAMPLERIEHGALVKDGAGAFALEMSNAGDLRATVALDAVSTVIRDGELAFRGLGQQRKLTYSYLYPRIGSPDALFPSAQPGLVLDNIDANFAASPFAFPCITVGTETSIVSPYLYVTNGCKVQVSSLQLGAIEDKDDPNKDLRHKDLEPHVVVGRSILQIASRLNVLFNRSGRLKMEVSDESTLEVSGTDLRGDMDLTVDGSVLKGFNAKDASANLKALVPLKFGVGFSGTNDLRFVNGAELHADIIGIDISHTNKNVLCRMTFDDARWIPSWDSDFTFSFGQVGTEIFVKGTGLRLAPPEGTVWTMREPVTDAADGAGGLVVDGEGTVVLGGQYRNYTGTTRVLSGTLDLAGDDWTRARIAGKGEIANGALVRPVLDVTGEEPAYVDASALATSVSGRITVDFGRTEDNPLAVGKTYKAAEYTGAEPDVSSWRLTGSGIRNVRGRFSCADGVVSVVPEYAGLSIIFR